MSRENDERLQNLLIFKVYVTDRELEEMVSALLILFMIVAAVVFCFWLFSDHRLPVRPRLACPPSQHLTRSRA